MLAALFAIQAAVAAAGSPAPPPVAPAAAAPAAAATAVPAEEAEVVVVARRGRCSVAIADRIISDREFRARAAEWAKGVPVRIVVPDRSDYRCMARIMFRLRDYGVTRAAFVAPGSPR